MRPDYYSILQISKTASVEEIKVAFRKLAMRFHPDKNPGAEDKFRSILEAYDVLIDPVKRRKYDAGSFYFENYRKHSAPKTTRNKQKDYSFTDEQFRERQEFAKRYREHYKKKQQEENAALPSYSDFKYIMISIPLAVALLFFVINSWNGEERKTVDPGIAVKPHANNSTVERKLQEVIKDSLKEKEQRAMANMYISPWNKVIGIPVFDTSSAKVLRIENRSGADAVVCLYDEQKKKFIRNNYVADGFYLLMEYLPAGKYHLRVVYGKDWNTANQTTDFNYEGMFDSVLVYAKFNSQRDKIIVQSGAVKKSDTIVRELPVITKIRTTSRINNHEFFWN